MAKWHDERWGFLVIDQGSGAWSGMRLLQIYVAHCDGNVCESLPMQSVEQRIGSEASDIQQIATESGLGVDA